MLRSFHRIQKSTMIVNEHIDRRARQTARLKSPSGNCRHGFLIEAAAVQRPDDSDLRRPSVTGDDRFQHNGALDSVSERLVR